MSAREHPGEEVHVCMPEREWVRVGYMYVCAHVCPWSAYHKVGCVQVCRCVGGGHVYTGEGYSHNLSMRMYG